jgi:hypothetical protein
VSRAIAVVVFGVVKAIAGAKKEAGYRKQASEQKKNELDIH